MAQLVITAQVDDAERWAERFRSRASFFREMGANAYGLKSPISYGIGKDNYVTVIEEVSDGKKALEAALSEENKKAMEEDKVKVDTAKFFLVDRELAF